MAVTKELLQMDLYALLGIGEKAADKEVKKAYRQKALSCHPDKNPDNPRAAELFHQLSQALEVLTDAAARIERLREEGSRQLEEQQRLIQEQIRQEREQRLRGESPVEWRHPLLYFQLKWKSTKESESQGGYSKDVLLRLLQKYGEVLNLVLSSKKAGTAVVEFATVRAAELAVQNEVGLVDNPLKISWLEGRPQSSMGPSHPGASQGSVLSERDYESLVMMRMRQAAERQQLIAQMQQEEQAGQPT
uniref:DnaJ heat shock protein family (Hsp40) member C17 n=2 Tax=Sus scrofa TaxID=9823 RepID=A0A8D1AWQ9_PIG